MGMSMTEEGVYIHSDTMRLSVFLNFQYISVQLEIGAQIRSVSSYVTTVYRVVLNRQGCLRLNLFSTAQ